MPEDLSTTVQLPFRARVRHGVRHPHNWVQLIRFAAVGATGYAVNLAAFAFCLHVIGIDYRVSAVVAYVVSVTNNFWWNRHWTFSAKEGRAVHQGLRFFAVSLVTFGVSYAVLVMLVDGGGTSKDLAQAISIAAGMPLNFIGQKLWSFRS
jgi:putative flippase GtrA